MKIKVYDYGYDINQVGRQIFRPQRKKTKWGYFAKASDNKHYGLAQAFIKKGKVFPLDLKNYSKKEAVVYLESGLVEVKIRNKVENLKPQDTLFFAESFNNLAEIKAKKDSCLYIFSGPPTVDNLKKVGFKKARVFNFRDQFWADMLWTMVNREFAGKKIYFRQGNNSSLHFHRLKTETYFVHSGKLFLRFKAGKGEDRFFVLEPGQAVDILPGLVHQAGGLEDTVIMEVSTRDYDADAFLIESEFTKMPQILERIYRK